MYIVYTHNTWTRPIYGLTDIESPRQLVQTMNNKIGGVLVCNFLRCRSFFMLVLYDSSIVWIVKLNFTLDSECCEFFLESYFPLLPLNWICTVLFYFLVKRSLFVLTRFLCCLTAWIILYSYGIYTVDELAPDKTSFSQHNFHQEIFRKNILEKSDKNNACILNFWMKKKIDRLNGCMMDYYSTFIVCCVV